MALIKCKECGQEASDMAASCPKCGAPIALLSVHAQVKTIQKTGKGLKLQSLLSALLIIVGVVWFIGQPSPFPGILIGIGVFWSIVNRIRTWWRHD